MPLHHTTKTMTAQSADQAALARTKNGMKRAFYARQVNTALQHGNIDPSARTVQRASTLTPRGVIWWILVTFAQRADIKMRKTEPVVWIVAQAVISTQL
jgi:hypothetical protein